MTQRVFGVVGWKNTGKTTLAENLVRELCQRGWRVSTVKHAHHGFDIDKPDTDSHRHRLAGAIEVAIVSGRRWALMHELRGESEPPLEDILGRLAPCDIVIVEGYKRASYPKIETRRLGVRENLAISAEDQNVVALAADHPLPDEQLPCFDLDDIAAIADFVETATGLSR